MELCGDFIGQFKFYVQPFWHGLSSLYTMDPGIRLWFKGVPVTGKVNVGECDGRDRAQGKRGPSTSHMTVRLPSQLRQQRLGVLQVGGVKALGEPAVNRRKQLTRCGLLALLLPQAAQA